MRYAILLLSLILIGGCATIDTEFTDVDGTHFAQHVCIPPFSALDASDASLLYDWSEKGLGRIAVGAAVTGIDTTPQVEAMKAAIAAGVAAAIAYTTGGVVE